MTGKNVHQRLHAVMGEVEYIQKEKKAGMRYTIVSHDAVTAKVRPVLVKHGIVYYPVALSRNQSGNRTEIDLTVRFANIDDPADHIDVVAAGYGVDDQDKGPGKAISYAVKYCLLKALGLETGDDPEEVQDDGARHHPAPGASSVAPKANGHSAAPAKVAKPVPGKGFDLLFPNGDVMANFKDPDEFCHGLRQAIEQDGALVTALWERNKPVAEVIRDHYPGVVWADRKGAKFPAHDFLAAIVRKLTPGLAA